MKEKKKVYVGLSGGVDSSVSAALLKKEGYDVTGVFIKVWQPDWISCTWKEDRLDAMRVCAKLDIPFVTLDLENEYKKEVVDYMIDEYKAGRTPNPDVMCNKYVKFGGFFDWAMAQGADFVATGHYARVSCGSSSLRSPSSGTQPSSLLKDMRFEESPSRLTVTEVQSEVSGRGMFLKGLDGCVPWKGLPREDAPCTLLAGCDSNKDQSYFLWTLTQHQLAHTLFPVGHLEKPEVRKLAEQFDLITADKKDSQGLCFIGKVDMKEFLKTFIDSKKGKVLDEQGNMIGEHDGAVFLTIGERHGFTITKKGSEDAPHYVISKNVEKNTVTVAHKDATGALSQQVKKVTLRNVSWITPLETNKTYQARPRYRAALQPCVITKKADIYSVVFNKPQNAVTSGQSLVVYDAEECKGGGIIE